VLESFQSFIENKYWLIVCAGVILSFVSSCDSEKARTDLRPTLEYELDYALELIQNPETDPVTYLDSVFAANPKANVFDIMRKYSLMHHYYHHYRRNFDMSIIYSDSLIQFLEPRYINLGLDFEYFDAVMGKGNMYMLMSQMGTAFTYFMQIRPLIERNNDPCTFYLLHDRFGLLSYRAGDFQEAIRYYKLANKDVNECQRFDDTKKNILNQGNFNNIASSFTQMAMPDSSLYYYRIVNNLLLEYEEAVKDEPVVAFRVEEARGVLIGNVGTINLMLGDTLNAENYWLRSIDINTRPTFPIGHAQIMSIRLGNLYLEQNRLDEVGAVLDWLETTFDEIKVNPTFLNWKELRYKYYEKLQQYDEAFIAMTDYLDEKKAYEKQRLAIDLERELFITEREHVIDILESEANLKNFYLYAASLFVAMGSVIIGLILFQKKRLKQYIDAIEATQKEILETNKELEQVNNDISKIMKTVAHDLRNPLTGIIGISSVLSENKALSASDREMLSLINSAGFHADSMIDEIIEMDISHSSAIKNKENINLDQFLHQIVSMMQYKANEKQQLLHLITEKEVSIFANKDKIMRLISNLISNAIKFSPKNSDINIVLSLNHETAIIKVVDNGIGIPTMYLAEIFNMFTSAKRVGTEGEKPFGLGLYISKSIAIAHGGKITVESTQGEGSTFTVMLPFRNDKQWFPST
jgi:signal transduction histidine kinase